MSQENHANFETFRFYALELVFDASLDDLVLVGDYSGTRGKDYHFEFIFKPELCQHRMDYIKEWVHRMDDDNQDTPPECDSELSKDDPWATTGCPVCGQRTPILADWEIMQNRLEIMLPLLQSRFPQIQRAEYRLGRLGTRQDYLYEFRVFPEPAEEDWPEIKRIEELAAAQNGNRYEGEG